MIRSGVEELVEPLGVLEGLEVGGAVEHGGGALKVDWWRRGGGDLLLDEVVVGAVVHVGGELGGGDAEALAEADELLVGVAGPALLGLLGVEAGVEVGELALLGGGDGGIGGEQGV